MSEKELALKYDLSTTVAKYLDKHLIFYLLEFVQSRELYDVADIMAGKLQLIKKTNMIDYAIDIHQQLYGDGDSQELEKMTQQRKLVIEKLKKLQQDSAKLLEFLMNPNSVRQLRQDKGQNLKFLQEEFEIGLADLDSLYNYAKFQFDCGNYSMAAQFLHYYQQLSTDNERNLSALWGVVAAEILMGEWQQASADIKKLRELLDTPGAGPSDPAMQLQQRTWLMHWALFVFWNHLDGRAELVELFMSERYQGALQINAQHLLRYLVTAVILNKRRSKSQLNQLLRLIQQESYEYSDPITEFLACVFTHNDFDAAQEKLKECESVLENDYFLTACKEEFVDSARLIIFETFCRIHHRIDMRMLADKLNMKYEEAEKWIANLIKTARLGAKIDSSAGMVMMSVGSSNGTDSLLEKAREVSLRTFMLANSVLGTDKGEKARS
eukprot:TRINITY_DN11794_c0_g1_i5.p1 TRINITY_DN11794_c0_g1~~TRINITY_DN11794_c0_g1_i5.p1  ORF type:complete len:455 (-),score=85.58 TRINITY_DN11794_c0_g1_i5:1002-2318(-)